MVLAEILNFFGFASIQAAIEIVGLPIFFLGSLISSATIVIPLPFDFLVFGAAAANATDTFFLFWLTVMTGVGAGIGELSAYFLGLGGERAWTSLKKKHKLKEIIDIQSYFDKYGFWAVVLFAATPLPLDIIGILAGLARYDIKAFFVGALIGKLIKYALIVVGASLGIEVVYTLFANGST